MVPNLVGRLLAATVMAVGTRAGATPQLSFALLPEATTTGMPSVSVMWAMESSIGFDQEPAGTPKDRDTTAGLTAFCATQSRPVGAQQEGVGWKHRRPAARVFTQASCAAECCKHPQHVHTQRAALGVVGMLVW